MSVNIDFDFLAQETLALKNQPETSTELSFDRYFEDLHEENFIACHDSEEAEFPEAPGLLFYIEKGANTFCLRGVSTDDIAYTANELLSGGSKLEKKFKTDINEIKDQLMSFVTDEEAEAEVLIDLVFNRRFPIHEDVLCNISDPGFSWWMKNEEDSFSIYFQSHGIERAQNFLRLGPLGESVLSSRRLSDALPYLRDSFSINEFSSNRKSFTISSARANCEDFKAFQDIFVTGSKPLSREMFPMSSAGLTLYLFFKELALTRRFLLLVESQVHS